MSFWIRVERLVAYVVAYALLGAACYLVAASVIGDWEWWWLFVAAVPIWAGLQVADALLMTGPPRWWERRRAQLDQTAAVDWEDDL